MNSWSMMDVLMCRSGQYRIRSYKVVAMVDMLMSSSGQWRDIKYAHVLEWYMQCGYNDICRFNLRCSDVIVEDLKATKHD